MVRMDGRVDGNVGGEANSLRARPSPRPRRPLRGVLLCTQCDAIQVIVYYNKFTIELYYDTHAYDFLIIINNNITIRTYMYHDVIRHTL